MLNDYIKTIQAKNGNVKDNNLDRVTTTHVLTLFKVDTDSNPNLDGALHHAPKIENENYNTN